MTNLLRTAFAISLSSYLAGCSSPSSDDGTGGSNGLGGQGSGGKSSGGSGTVGNGGSPAGGATSGGSSQGGAPGSGGQASGGKSAGGTGTVGTGGASEPKGGASSGGSGNGSAGASSGGRSNNGGASTGGSGSGGSGMVAGAGGGGATCPMPTSFKWTSGGPIASPKSGWVSIKDFTYAPYNNKHVIYMTTHDTGTKWAGAMMTFSDWPAAATATQTALPFTAVAPTLFYFTPKQTWVLAYQWGSHKFSYRTASDPTSASGWSGEKALFNGNIDGSSTGPIDQTVICDATNCYLFFAGDNGKIYRASMPIGSFPGEFKNATTIMSDTAQKLFEAVQVYSIKGSNKYLMLVEAQGNGRYFRAWTATDLGGTWTLLTDNFAIKSNTTFSQNWTNDISHGDMIRGADETFPIDPCNLQMIFQGRDPNSGGDYGLLPYKLGLLTAAK